MNSFKTDIVNFRIPLWHAQGYSKIYILCDRYKYSKNVSKNCDQSYKLVRK